MRGAKHPQSPTSPLPATWRPEAVAASHLCLRWLAPFLAKRAVDMGVPLGIPSKVPELHKVVVYTGRNSQLTVEPLTPLKQLALSAGFRSPTFQEGQWPWLATPLCLQGSMHGWKEGTPILLRSLGQSHILQILNL